MASAFSHALVAGAIGTALYRPGVPRWFWFAGVVCAVAPDIDVLAFRFGIPYDNPIGHRGLSHSLIVAAGVALVGAAAVRRRLPAPLPASRLAWFLFLAMASHGLLDALTNGGLGVALFAPVDNGRYFLPWRPIQVSPISVWRFFSAAGIEVLRSEAVWNLAALLRVRFCRRLHPKGPTTQPDGLMTVSISRLMVR